MTANPTLADRLGAALVAQIIAELPSGEGVDKLAEAQRILIARGWPRRTALQYVRAYVAEKLVENFPYRPGKTL